MKACSACSLQGNANINYCSNSCMTKCQVARHTIPSLKQTLDTSQYAYVVVSNNISHLPLSELTSSTDVHMFTGTVCACMWHQCSVAEQMCVAWHDSIAQHIPEAVSREEGPEPLRAASRADVSLQLWHRTRTWEST